MRWRLPFFRRDRRESELDAELRFHLETQIRDLVAAGTNPDAARRQAMLEFGGLEQIKEQCRDQRSGHWLDANLQDLRHAVRSLLRAKTHTTVTVLTLALGIGSAAAIFSIIDWVLFRSITFPEGLVLVGATNKQGQFNGARYEVHVQAYRDQARVFSEYGLARPFPHNIALNGEPVASGVIGVSANLLPMLGVTPVLGRGFLSEENTPGRNHVLIISHAFWQTHFHGAPDVLGRKLVVDQLVCTVVGVLGPRPSLPPNLKTEVFLPLELTPAFKTIGYWYVMFARLRSGITPEMADAELAEIPVELPQWIAVYSPFNRPHVETMAELQAVQRSETYWILVAAVAFLYGIACLNATNLMLVRLLGRKREFSIRLALGGGRGRLIRLLAWESFLLSVAASAVGVMLANWLAPLLMTLLQPGSAFRWAHWSLDVRALGILAGLSALTTLLILIVPAVRLLRADVLDGLKDGGVTAGEGPALGRLRRGIVVLQAVFAVILLTGAGLMVRTLAKLQHVPLGFDDRQLIKVQLAYPGDPAYRGTPQLQRLERLQEQLERVPGVVSVSYGTDNLVRGTYDATVTVATADGPPIRVELDFISPDFLKTAGLGLKRGRMAHRIGAELLINDTFARAMFGSKDPIGQSLRPVEGGESRYEWHIVGVIGDVRDTLRSTPGNHLYAPVDWSIPAATTILVRTSRAADAELPTAIKRAIYVFDPRIVVSYVAPMAEVRGWQSNFERFVASGLKVLSGLALALTIVGLFSVLAYTVDQRMREFGIRLVLGATPRDLIGLVVRSGLLMVLAGVAIGLAGAVALSRYLGSLLYGIAPYDPVILGAVAVILIAAAVLSSALPAYRATKANVARLLRAE